MKNIKHIVVRTMVSVAPILGSLAFIHVPRRGHFSIDLRFIVCSHLAFVVRRRARHDVGVGGEPPEERLDEVVVGSLQGRSKLPKERAG
jgi:hypothetical protein